MELGCGEVPFSFHVDDRRGLFHIQAIGEVNGAELMELSDRLRHEAAFVAEYPILCDCSNLTAVSISSSLIESLARCKVACQPAGNNCSGASCVWLGTHVSNLQRSRGYAHSRV